MGKFDKSNLAFIDVETPNRKNDRICSIAIIATKNDLIISEEYYLVNPECSFSDENINIHKINPALVRDKPKFPEVWEAVKHYFTNGIVLAHNAPFDLGVLCKTLSYYNIDVPDFYYVCTMNVAKTLNHKSNALKNLCSEYGIALETHHNSFYDALACRDLFAEFQKRIKIDDMVKCYQFDGNYRSWESDNLLRKAMNELSGIVHGLVSDNSINAAEISALESWMDSYGKCIRPSQFAELKYIILSSIEDQQISKSNLDKLKLFFKGFQFKRSAYNDATQAMQILMGIIRGLLADSELNEEEILSLRRWMDQHKYLSGNYPFNKIDEQLDTILEDGVITQNEKEKLFETLNRFASPDLKSDNNHGEAIVFDKMIFCLTGNFNHGSKTDIEMIIVRKGGAVQSNVTKKTNYLIVGGAGSQDWKFGNYGSKVNRALQLQEKGLDIKIISEKALFD